MRHIQSLVVFCWLAANIVSADGQTWSEPRLGRQTPWRTSINKSERTGGMAAHKLRMDGLPVRTQGLARRQGTTSAATRPCHARSQAWRALEHFETRAAGAAVRPEPYATPTPKRRHARPRRAWISGQRANPAAAGRAARHTASLAGPTDDPITRNNARSPSLP